MSLCPKSKDKLDGYILLWCYKEWFQKMEIWTDKKQLLTVIHAFIIEVPVEQHITESTEESCTLM